MVDQMAVQMAGLKAHLMAHLKVAPTAVQLELL